MSGRTSLNVRKAYTLGADCLNKIVNFRMENLLADADPGFLKGYTEAETWAAGVVALPDLSFPFPPPQSLHA